MAESKVVKRTIKRKPVGVIDCRKKGWKEGRKEGRLVKWMDG